MDKTYNPASIEQRWYQTWEEKGYFSSQAQLDSDQSAYCIMIPPPNVTGHLHMGHAFQDTIMDTLIRYQRMLGKKTLWQPGTDHAGIATQMVVERLINAEGKTRHDLGRDAFIEKVWKWKHQSGNKISQQLRRMGASLDWQRERFTMDEGLSEAVREVFVQLYEQDLIYRGKRLVNWDPVLHTAVSDLEVISTEEDGHMWHMRYPFADGEGYVVVATTRPETMLGDAAVAVHPEDERYQHLIGKKLKLPLTDRAIPVIADDYVDPEFGTGCVKITPAHDFNDYAMGKRHNLPLLNIFTIDACLNENTPDAYQGMDRYQARKQIVADLQQQGLLEKIVDHKLMVPRGDRSNAVIEPFLTDQWFVRIAPLAQPAIDAVKNGDIRFVPDNWKNTYFHWMENIEDWCISRQIWWGHRIPAWYDEQDHFYVGRSEQEVREKYQLADDIPLRQDEDVLDTWFSSALWPFSTLGWPKQTRHLQTFYPTNVLVTGFDIIFFWVARMIMFGLKFTGEVPFREVYMHGLVRDAHGQKMSKSKGNVLDPIDLIDGIDLESLVKKRTQGLMQPQMAKKIEQQTRKDFKNGIPAFGTDALRFTFAIMATTGRDIKFDMGRIEGYRNFCNKLWNASRFVLMNTQGQDCAIQQDFAELPLTLADQWILSCLQQTIVDVRRHLDDYRLDLAAQAIYDFTWNEYCDWYLELAKINLGNSDPDIQKTSRKTLLYVLEKLLRLAHPMIPFISEEIWQIIAPLAGVTTDKKAQTIMLQAYPLKQPQLIFAQAGEEIQWLQDVVMAIRKMRGALDISPGKKITVLYQPDNTRESTRFEQHQALIMRLAKLDSLKVLQDEDSTDARNAVSEMVGGSKILIPLRGVINKDEESARLQKEISKLDKYCQGLIKKLENKNFVERAPQAVVSAEQDKLQQAQTRLNGLYEQLQRIKAL